jgi:hypothetical protein
MTVTGLSRFHPGQWVRPKKHVALPRFMQPPFVVENCRGDFVSFFDHGPAQWPDCYFEHDDSPLTDTKAGKEASNDAARLAFLERALADLEERVVLYAPSEPLESDAPAMRFSAGLRSALCCFGRVAIQRGLVIVDIKK